MKKWLKHIFIKNTTFAMLAASISASIVKMATILVGDAEKNETQQFAIHDKFNNHSNDLDIIKTVCYVGLPALSILISWIITAIEITDHHYGWEKHETQERKRNSSNLDDLERTAQDYYKYKNYIGHLYYTYLYQQKNKPEQSHPIHLCDEKGVLLFPPAIVSSKGTVHSLKEFKQLAESKTHSAYGIKVSMMKRFMASQPIYS